MYITKMLVDDFYIVLIVILLSLLIVRYKNYWRAVELAFKLPGPPAVPLLGNVFLITKNKKLEEIGTNMQQFYGPIIRIWVSAVPFFFITEPQHLQNVLSSNSVSEKNVFYSFLHNFLGEGLITSNGYKWKRNRKFIQPFMHPNVLKVFFDVFTRRAEVLTQKLANERDIKITPYVNRYVLEVLYETILGESMDEFETSPFRKGEVILSQRVVKPWLMLNSIFKLTNFFKVELQQKDTLRSYMRKVLQEKRRAVKENPCREATNIIEMMVDVAEDNPDFSDQDIINECCTFMLAGQDSTGATLAFTLFYIAQNPHVQKRIMKELNGIFKSREQKVTFEDLSEMKYLEQTIKESMRLCPSVPMFTRVLLNDVNLGKRVFPAGSNLVICPFVTHRLEHLYPDPLKFDPDRFAQDKQIHPYAFIPFSAGPRNCIGHRFAVLEIKTLISEILRKFQLNLVPGHEELDLSYRVTLRAKGGIWVSLKPRDN